MYTSPKSYRPFVLRKHNLTGGRSSTARTPRPKPHNPRARTPPHAQAGICTRLCVRGRGTRPGCKCWGCGGSVLCGRRKNDHSSTAACNGRFWMVHVHGYSSKNDAHVRAYALRMISRNLIHKQSCTIFW